MSQQEDDLRALAKIMDFLRAISIVLVVANLYYFTRVETVDSGWFYSMTDKILNNFNRTCGLFHNTFNSKLFALLLLGLSCFGTKGGEKRKNHMAAHNHCILHRLYTLFPELVDAGNRVEVCLYRHYSRRVRLSDDGRNMD